VGGEKRGEMTEDEVRKQSLERYMWQLEFEEMRIKSIAHDEIKMALREFVDRFIENLETNSELDDSRGFWRRILNRFFGRYTLEIVKKTMKETAETVMIGSVKGLKPKD
jgi:hypothetical protein